MESDPERIQRLMDALAGTHLDALCCRLPQNVLLLTGYWPMLGNSVALLTREGACALIIPEDERDLARRGWVEDAAIHTFTPVTLEHMGNADDAIRPLLAEAARSLGLGRAEIGYEGAAEMTPAPYVALHAGGPTMLAFCQAVIPEANYWDASALLDAQRAVLTARECALVRRACAAAGAGFAAARAAIRPGATETEIAAAVHAAIAAESHRDGAAHRAVVHAFCMSGPRSADAYRAYALTDGRSLQRGDSVLVHCNSALDGFWTDLTRTYVLGEPDARQLAMYEAVLEARGRALGAIRAGVRAADVDAAARDHLKRAGFGAAFKHQLGHGVGYGAISHGNRPRLHPCSNDILEAGMVFNVEPALYFDGMGGLRICDVVAAGTAGADVLSPFSDSLDDLIVSDAG